MKVCTTCGPARRIEATCQSSHVGNIRPTAPVAKQ